MNLAAAIGVFDLNFGGPVPHPSARGGMRNELGPNGVRAVDGFHSRSRISALRGALPRPVSRPEFFLLGSVSLHGFCAAHLSRESARHRNVPARAGCKVVSPEHSRSHFAL